MTTSVPQWPHLVAQLSVDVTVGVGTVTSIEQARAAVASRARFIVTPYFVPEVVAWCGQEGIEVIPGGLTPGELAASGEKVVKVFPAHIGGPSYLRSLRAILPTLKFVPTGGITWSEVDSYAAAGALAVGIGSGLDLPDEELKRCFDQAARE
jgi:2-dehydro-3-deoxyphosphogluconate aldolase/(4S)-4-hydroxy-2-oxoglutarate aldolase